MKSTAFSLAVACLVVGVGPRAQHMAVFGFDQDKPGTPPAGFAFAAMRQPAPGAWVVHRTGANGYLAHAPDTASQGYAMAVVDHAPPNDVTISVRLRLAGGRRAGGVVWHYVDSRNYYACVLDLSRREISMYRIAGGSRSRMEFEDDLELDADAWHAMKVAHNGRETRVSLGGVRVFAHSGRDKDGAAAGRVGLIAAGDADVWFDDLSIDHPRN